MATRPIDPVCPERRSKALTGCGKNGLRDLDSLQFDTKRTQGVVVRYSLLWAYVAEHIQLLLVVSSHAFFLSGCAVETREFRGTA